MENIPSFPKHILLCFSPSCFAQKNSKGFCLIFKWKKPFIFFFSETDQPAPAQLACLFSGYSLGRTGTRGASSTVGLIQRLGHATFPPWPEGTPAVSLTAGGHPGASASTWPRDPPLISRRVPRNPSAVPPIFRSRRGAPRRQGPPLFRGSGRLR